MPVKFVAHKIWLIFKEKMMDNVSENQQSPQSFIIRPFEDIVVFLILSTARILTGIHEIPIVCL